MGSLGGMIINPFQSKGVQKQMGLRSEFEAQNPYDQSYLQAQVDNQAKVQQQQQALANQLQAMSQGQGPNPAQTQYLQNVGQNVSGAQGMIASQRGINPALAARMGANVQAAAGNQAANEAAQLQQKQQLASTAMLGDVYGQMQQGNLMGQQLYGGQSLGTQQMGQQTSAQNASNMAALYGSIIGAGGKAATMGAAHGGEVPSYAMGGDVDGPMSMAGQYLGSAPMLPMPMASHGGEMPINFMPGGAVPGKAKHPGDDKRNDVVHAMVSPGEIVIPRTVAQGGDAPEKARQFVAAIMARKRHGVRK